jgi:hypothetical protein
MTLYYDVQTKDELFTLMIDAVMSEGIRPLPRGDGGPPSADTHSGAAMIAYVASLLGATSLASSTASPPRASNRLRS